MRHRRVTVAFALAIALAGSCTGDRSTRDGGDAVAGRVHLRVATAPYLAFAPLYVAQARGYFAEEGLDVELVPLVGSEIAVPLLVDGSIDILPSQTSPGLLNAIGRGAMIRLVGRVQDMTMGRCSPIEIVARPGLLDAARTGPLPVRRVSLNRQSVMLWLAAEAFASVGLNLDSLEVVDIPNAAEADAIESGAIDAALAGEPWLSRTLAAGQAESWIRVTDVMPDVEVTLVYFGRRLIEREREAGVRFMRALQAALRALGEGPTEENVDVLSRFTGQNPDILRRACWAFGPTDGQVRYESIMRFQDWAVQRGLVDRVVPWTELWDPGFATDAIDLPIR